MGRDIFSGVKIHHLGGIEDESQKSSITGSCKHVLIRDAAGTEINIVVDFGMHQGGKSDNDFNTQIDGKVISADYIFVTHAHLDHIGRLPMLVSRGFKGKIIMTPATMELGYLSLLDSAKIMQDEYEAKKEERRKKGQIASDVARYTDFENKKTLTPEELARKNEIEKKHGIETIKKMQDMLARVKGDISKLLPELPLPLYTMDDVYHLFSRFPKQVLGFNEDQKQMEDFEGEEERIRREHSQFFDVQIVDTSIKKDKKEFIATPTSFIETHQFGEKIPLVCQKNGKKLDGSLLSIQQVVAHFLPAGHILGSAQLEIKIGVDRILKGEQVDVMYSRNEHEEYRLFFGGDMGRFDTGNNLGAPQFPNGEYLYREMEGTYATKNHPDRAEAIARLYSILQSAGKHILLPNFSLQRTPDMLILLLDYVEQICIPESNRLKQKNKFLKAHIKDCKRTLSGTNDNELISQLKREIEKVENEMQENREKIDILDVVIISDSPLFQKTLPVYISEKPEIYGVLSEEGQKKRFGGKVIIKYLPPQESKKFFDRYDTKTSKPAQDRRTKIIVSSGGMCEGGPVIGHLQRMVPQPNADIIFTGYAPPTSLAGKLKGEDPQVIIEGAIYEVYAKIHDITGFSGHAGQDELIEWHSAGKMVKGGVDAIVHGGSARSDLATKLNKSHKTAGVICPKLGEMIEIPFPIGKVRNRIVRK